MVRDSTSFPCPKYGRGEVLLEGSVGAYSQILRRVSLGSTGQRFPLLGPYHFRRHIPRLWLGENASVLSVRLGEFTDAVGSGMEWGWIGCPCLRHSGGWSILANHAHCACNVPEWQVAALGGSLANGENPSEESTASDTREILKTSALGQRTATLCAQSALGCRKEDTFNSGF